MRSKLCTTIPERFLHFKPSLFSPKLIEKYLDAFNYELKQQGIWGAKIIKEEPAYKKDICFLTC